MKTLKKVLGILGILIILICISLALFFNSLKPEYSGKQTLENLNEEVTVFYDAYGIPHIYSQNNEDAFRTLGYVHAQDRLWQMELLRRIAKGRLSEVFGADLLDTDKFFLSLGIDDSTKETLRRLPKDSEAIKLSQAYLDGINSFIENGPKPVEFYLTGIELRPFSLEDVYNAIGYMAFSFAMAHKTDPLLTEIRNELGPEYVKDLAMYSDPTTEWIKNYKNTASDSISTDLSAAVYKAMEKLPIPQFEGSNSWVLGPQKTKSGKVILANDPHIGFAQPSVWYEAHLSTPTYEKYGYHLAGVPFPLLGHNRDIAYGLTMFQNDDLDFYFEQNHPSDSTLYKTEDGWKLYEIVEKSIPVKDGEPVSFQYKKTRHGPVLNGIATQIRGERPIVMSWMYTKLENKLMDALYGLAFATDLKTFESSLPYIHAPGLNVMYGDAKGNVAWWASAKLYQMPDSISTKFVLNGSTGEEEPVRYLDFTENPSAINPPWHYVYSANNQPDSIVGMAYPGYYQPENRARRIVEYLEPKDNWDKEAVSEMILDVTSSVNPELVRELIKLLDISHLQQEQLVAVDKLRNWDGAYTLDSQSALLYHRAEYFVIKNTFEDELGEEKFQQFLGTHLMKRHIAKGAIMKVGKWWDNIHTPYVEDRNDIVLKSFADAWTSLVKDFGTDTKNWTWGKAHTLEHKHPIGEVETLRKYFNVGPFPVEGSREVINNLSFPYDSTGFYKVSSGPSTRRIIDFADIENSISILPTGQSGNPFSEHYDDQAEMFVKGEFRKMMMNKAEIEEKAKSKLVFVPGKE